MISHFNPISPSCAGVVHRMTDIHERDRTTLRNSVELKQFLTGIQNHLQLNPLDSTGITEFLQGQSNFPPPDTPYNREMRIPAEVKAVLRELLHMNLWGCIGRREASSKSAEKLQELFDFVMQTGRWANPQPSNSGPVESQPLQAQSSKQLYSYAHPHPVKEANFEFTNRQQTEMKPLREEAHVKLPTRQKFHVQPLPAKAEKYINGQWPLGYAFMDRPRAIQENITINGKSEVTDAIQEDVTIFVQQRKSVSDVYKMLVDKGHDETDIFYWIDTRYSESKLSAEFRRRIKTKDFVDRMKSPSSPKTSSDICDELYWNNLIDGKTAPSAQAYYDKLKESGFSEEDFLKIWLKSDDMTPPEWWDFCTYVQNKKNFLSSYTFQDHQTCLESHRNLTLQQWLSLAKEFPEGPLLEPFASNTGDSSAQKMRHGIAIISIVAKKEYLEELLALCRERCKASIANESDIEYALEPLVKAIDRKK